MREDFNTKLFAKAVRDWQELLGSAHVRKSLDTVNDFPGHMQNSVTDVIAEEAAGSARKGGR